MVSKKRNAKHEALDATRMVAELERLGRARDFEAKRFVETSLRDKQTGPLLCAFVDWLPTAKPAAIAHLADALLSSWTLDEAGFVPALQPHVGRCLAAVEELLDKTPPTEVTTDNPVGLAASRLLDLVTDDSNGKALAERIARLQMRRALEQPAINASLSLTFLRILGPGSVAPLLTRLLARPCAIEGGVGTALDAALETVREGHSTFRAPLDLVARIVVEAADRSPALLPALIEAGRELCDERRDALLLVAGYTGTWELQYGKYAAGTPKAVAKAFEAKVKELCAALGPGHDPTVRKRLAQFGLVTDRRPALPRDLPRTLDAALALHADLGLESILGGPAQAPSSLPAPLVAFYARHDRLGSGTIAPPAKLPQLTKNLARWVRSMEDEAEDEDGEVDEGSIHLGALSPVAELVPFGKDAAGDFFFIDPAFTHDEEPPVLRLHHEERMRVSVAASCLPAFVAATLLEAAFGSGRHGKTVATLVARDRARVRVPAKLSRRPKRRRR